MSPLSTSPAWIAFSKAALESPLSLDVLRIVRAADLDVDLSTQRNSPALAHASQALLAQQGFEAAR